VQKWQGRLPELMPDKVKETLIKRGSLFLAREAADSIKPGVERSETPGSPTSEACRAREAADRGLDY